MARGNVGSIRKRGSIYWIRYYVHGKRREESSGSDKRSVAQRLLRQRITEIGTGKLIGRDATRVDFEDLAGLLVEDYTVNGRRSLDRAERSLTHLRRFFGSDRAIAITTDRLHRYVKARLSDGAARSTVQNELSALKRGFRLAVDRQRLAYVPAFPRLTIKNARDEFFSEAEIGLLLVELPAELRSMVEFAAVTGWRVMSEVRTLTWEQIDFEGHVVRLHVGTTKNTEARTYPFTQQLEALLTRQRAYTDRCEQQTGHLIPWVFHRDGREIRSFRAAWAAACKRAGILGRDGKHKVPHDLRRTAVRRNERTNVPRTVSMALIGHKTESMYRRYSIVDEQDLREGAERAAAGIGTVPAIVPVQRDN